MKKLLALGLVILFSGSISQAMETKIGGFLGTRAGMKITTEDLPGDSTYNLSDMLVGISSLSRLNITGKLDEKVGFFVEFRPDWPIIEKIYGVVDLGPGQILAGKDESIYNLVWGKTGSPLAPYLIGHGNAWAGRIAQFRYTIPVARGALKVALCSPNVTSVSRQGAGSIQQHAAIPQIQCSFGQTLGTHSVELSGLVNSTAANKDEVEVMNPAFEDVGVTAYGIAGFAKIAAAPVAITLDGYYGQNLGFANANTGYSARYTVPEGETDTVVCNGTGYGGFVDGQLSFAPCVVKAGYGMDSGDYADLTEMDKVNSSYFVYLGCSVSPNMTIGLEYNASPLRMDRRIEENHAPCRARLYALLSRKPEGLPYYLETTDVYSQMMFLRHSILFPAGRQA
jgi:hypothetical protein